jgi:antitoxin component of MazEF toxin-antitoxin module
MKVGRRGSGLAVRIPKGIVRMMCLEVGDEVELVAIDGRLGLARRVTDPGPDERASSRHPEPGAD